MLIVLLIVSGEIQTRARGVGRQGDRKLVGGETELVERE